MTRSFCLLIALLAASSSFARAANNDQFDQRRAAEERACKGDAHRFCKDAIPDEFRTASCLQEHHDKISQACRSVLDGR
jgi:hypothetical protein